MKVEDGRGFGPVAAEQKVVGVVSNLRILGNIHLVRAVLCQQFAKVPQSQGAI